MVAGLLASACGAKGADEAADNDKATQTTAAGSTETTAAGDSASKFGSIASPCGKADSVATVKADEAGTGTDKLYIGVGNDRDSIRPGLLKELWDGTNAFVKWCNEQGGINGLQLEAVDLDGKVLEVEAAMARSIQRLTWLSDATKARAMAKLEAIGNKIGYPDRWRDYSALAVSRDDFFANVAAGTRFEVRRQLAKIGQPPDRAEWAMTPQTVNAYYDAQMNDINFPAGVLQPPMYDARLDDAPNYGNTGGTIGHELIHGFDDEGRQFDAKGNLSNWWTAEDAREFERRAACVGDQYKTYTIVDRIKINPKLTMGENLADFGGMVLAWAAWKAHVADKVLAPIDGLTPEQRFFVGFAQWDCGDTRPEALRVRALTDPHSPGRHRINGVVVNMPEFEQAFACKPTARLVKPERQRCTLW